MEASITRTIIPALVLLAAAAISVLVKADDGGTICGLTQAELMACKPYATAGAAVPPLPPKTGPCCAALPQADLACFCGLRNDWRLPFFGIDPARAMQLPHACDPTKPKNC